MGIMGRIAGLVKADVNGFLDDHENVERSLDQAVRDSTNNLMSAHDRLIDASAAVKALEHSVESAEALVNKWQETAELAVAGNDDDLLNCSLARKNIAKEALDAGQKNLTRQHENLADLEAKFEEAKVENETLMMERESLVARHKVTEVQDFIVKSNVASHNVVAGVCGVFARIRKRVEKQEYRSQAAIEHSQRHSSRNASGFSSRVNAEAAAMKAAWSQAQQQEATPEQPKQDDTDSVDPEGFPAEETSMVVSEQTASHPKA